MTKNKKDIAQKFAVEHGFSTNWEYDIQVQTYKGATYTFDIEEAPNQKYVDFIAKEMFEAGVRHGKRELQKDMKKLLDF